MNKIIIANWKMNLSIPEALRFVKNLKKTKNEVVLAAPFTFLGPLKEKMRRPDVKLAAQNVSIYEGGAFTGDVSAKMIKEVGCSFCLVGHSERRIYFQETDEQINTKIKNLLKHGVRPVLCVGETEAEKDKGMTSKVFKRQILGALAGIKKISQILIAYEPVWAISTFQKGKVKKAATEKDIVLAHIYIRNLLNNLFGQNSKKIKILYGGTVNPKNCEEILRLKQVDGALVGSASLKSQSFNAIIKI